MHIHGNSLAINAADLYSAAQADRAADAQRTADVRKKLLKGASQADAAATPEETLLISHWTDARHSQVQGEDAYRAAASGRVSEFD
ncbi:MAG: hypothetical protein ABR991_03580 [Terracidiphilus sp.]|jgi:hypothetical protein